MDTENKKLNLVSNGDMKAWESQELYELAWVNGIRPLDEAELKGGENQ